MNILAIDTSTEACSAALLTENRVIEKYQYAPQQHSELILGMIEELLEHSDLRLKDLQAIAFGRGPGSFVGVRIATGVAQGIAYAGGLPVLPVSSLAAMAQGFIDKQAPLEKNRTERLLVAIDARMQEIYWAEYKRDASGLVQLVGQEVVSAPNQVNISNPESLAQKTETNRAHYFGIGTGWETYRSELSGRFHTDDINAQVYPQARDILPLALKYYHEGVRVPANLAAPVYLRNQVVKKPQPKTCIDNKILDKGSV